MAVTIDPKTGSPVITPDTPPADNQPDPTNAFIPSSAADSNPEVIKPSDIPVIPGEPNTRLAGNAGKSDDAKSDVIPAVKQVITDAAVKEVYIVRLTPKKAELIKNALRMNGMDSQQQARAFAEIESALYSTL